MEPECYPFVVRPLSYEYDALTPILDEDTMYVHHDRHYKSYVDKLNSLLADYPQLQKMGLFWLLTRPEKLPVQIRTSVRNNAGGVFNHELYFDGMKECYGQEPAGALADAIERDFGSFRNWQDQMRSAALHRFGSGWVWLVCDAEGTLAVLETSNEDVPDLLSVTPILNVDVWEHAYYLECQSKRADYVNGWFDLIHWRKAGRRYEEAMRNAKRPDREDSKHESDQLPERTGENIGAGGKT